MSYRRQKKSSLETCLVWALALLILVPIIGGVLVGMGWLTMFALSAFNVHLTLWQATAVYFVVAALIGTARNSGKSSE
jgi:hypothetical protein